MESGIIGFLAIGLLLSSIAWLLVVLIKGIIRARSESRPREMSPEMRQPQPRPYRFPPRAQADPSQFDYELVPFETDDGQGRGYVVERLKDGQRLAWDFLSNRGENMESMGVAGETHHSEDLQADSFRPPAPLVLVPEPTNRYDPHAVAIWDAAKKHQAGYIPGSEARRIGGRLSKGKIVECLSMWETIVNGKRVSLRILLLDQKARLQKPTT